MSSRLIPWCLAATGFVAALFVITWRGELRDPLQRRPRHAPVEHAVGALAATGREFQSQHVAQTLTHPLPPATQPEPDPDAQPVMDDAPTVDDLPARRRESDTPQSE